MSQGITKLDLVYPDLRVRMRRIYSEVRRITLRDMGATDTLRSFKTQQALYEKGRQFIDGKWVKVGAVVTNARPGFSRHAYGLAVDSAFLGPDPYLEKAPDAHGRWCWDIYGQAVRTFGCRWGGDWNGNGTRDANDWDRPHCEVSYGLSLVECLELYEHGGVPAVWATIDKVRGVPVGQDWKNLVDAGLLA